MISFKVERVIAELSGTENKVKRLTVTSWSGNPGKLDIRTWGIPEEGGDPVPYKGITLTDEEAELLAEGLNEYFEGE